MSSAVNICTCLVSSPGLLTPHQHSPSPSPTPPTCIIHSRSSGCAPPAPPSPPPLPTLAPLTGMCTCHLTCPPSPPPPPPPAAPAPLLTCTNPLISRLLSRLASAAAGTNRSLPPATTMVRACTSGRAAATGAVEAWRRWRRQAKVARGRQATMDCSWGSQLGSSCGGGGGREGKEGVKRCEGGGEGGGGCQAA